MSDLVHIQKQLTQILDDLAKTMAGSEAESIRRLRREDLEGQNLYLLLTDRSDEISNRVDELERRRAVIDAVRGAISLGHSTQ